MKFTTCPEVETDLQTLALTAQASPPSSKERRLALKQLVERIMQSGYLCKPQIGNLSPPIYQEIHAEAVQDLLLFVCRKIDQYDSSRGTVLAWINMLLSRRFIKEAIPKVLNHTQVSNLTLPDLDQFVPPQASLNLVEELMAYIDADPNGEFRMAYIRYHPAANFQYLFQRRLAGDSWEAISDDQQSLHAVRAREQDNYIQLKRFQATLSETFNIVIRYGEICITESFQV